MNLEKLRQQDFPFEHHYVEVAGHQIHYIDEGKGSTIVFLHGMPTSNYLWRGIIPTMTSMARCLAPDLIGMGLSDKPNIDYKIETHCEIFSKWMEKLRLKNVILFVHGWGSVIGLDYASKHPDNVAGLVFFESYLKPIETWQQVPLPIQEQAQILNLPDGGFDLVMNSDYFVDHVLCNGMIADLPTETLTYYRELTQNQNTKKALWQFIQDMPLGDGPENTLHIMRHYNEWLQSTPIAKLFFYGIPGLLAPIKTIEWAKENLPNLTLIDIGECNHYSIDSHPEAFTGALQAWYLGNFR